MDNTVIAIYHSNDIYVIRAEKFNDFQKMSAKTDILGLCKIHKREMLFSFYFDNQFIITNGCSTEEGFSEFTKNHQMFIKMKQLGKIVGGKVTMKILFE